MSNMDENNVKAFMYGVMHYMRENIPDGPMSAETLMAIMSSVTMFLFSGYCRDNGEIIALMRSYAEGLSKLPYERIMVEAEQWLRRN